MGALAGTNENRRLVHTAVDRLQSVCQMLKLMCLPHVLMIVLANNGREIIGEATYKRASRGKVQIGAWEGRTKCVHMMKYCVACEPPKNARLQILRYLVSLLQYSEECIVGVIVTSRYTKAAMADRLAKQLFRTNEVFVLLTYLRTAEDEGMQVARRKSR